MEKRLFLAVGLSLLVVFAFQSFTGSQKKGTQEGFTQIVDNKQDIKESASVSEEKASQSPAKDEDVLDSEDVPEVKEDIFSGKAGMLAIEFTNKGGNIKSVRLLDYKCTLPVRSYLNVKEFENKIFQFTKASEREFEFSYVSKEWEITKEYKISNDYEINVTLKARNLTGTAKAFNKEVDAFVIDFSRMDINEFKSDWTLFEYSIKTNNKMIRKGSAANFTDKWNKDEDVQVEWLGFRDRYFSTILAPSQPVNKYLVKKISDKELSLGTILSTETIDPAASARFEFKVYAGPQKLDVLGKAGKNFEKILVFSDWGWLDAISKGIYWALGFLHKIFPSWGLCIILISLIVYGGMYPLTLKSMVSMKKMQAVQPKIAALREKHKNNPEKLNQETVELYRINQVNPLGGCLPLLFQMPIFVGLYQVLWRSIYFKGESFLWMQDLSMPDRLFKLPFNIPFLGEYFNILPIVMSGIMFVQQKLNMKSMAGGSPEQEMQQKMMATFFPVFLGFIFYNFSSGLNLYFVVFYLLSALSQWHISKDAKKAE